MIDLEPNEPTNYFVLADIYADSGEYELAEQTYLKAKEVRPNDPAVYMQLAGFYNSQGDFEKTIAAVNDRTKVEPNNPEAFQTLATYYWDKAYRDFRLTDKEKLQYVHVAASRRSTRPSRSSRDYMEAVAYKNLLLRLQANLSKRIRPSSRRCCARPTSSATGRGVAQAEGCRHQLVQASRRFGSRPKRLQRPTT